METLSFLFFIKKYAEIPLQQYLSLCYNSYVV